ncbi:MAG: HAMP domain-containing histidine kinase [Oribacterium sp.]|nr:HAMP domain-containing histidine kinase [Oribacterium sp.]MBO6309233.1 HAMP domain-containing histidine kinase [Oribacterium sp.]MBP3806606.1 HAMP domain-containing histidine kinase [Oribacterium sp.]MCR5008892.1 HAMP domain-containing histidine kinase [Oribacterium sp.]
MQLIANIGVSAVITAVLEVFLVTNITAITSFLYQTGNDSQTVKRFAFGSTISVLLFVLFGIAVFSFIFLMMQRKTARDIETIANAVQQISEGDLTTKLDVTGEGELTEIAENISRMEKDIRDLIEKERNSEQSKTDLITNVAHDLRTPLTSIIGYLELLRKNNSISPEMRQKYLDIAYNKSERLQKLIEELFGFTKLSYGKVNLNIKEVDIVKLLAQLLEESYPNFAKNGLSYDYVSNTGSQIIEADGDLLARLFDNLINNAIKYGKEGKRVKVNLRADREIVTIKIVNYGYVIPEKELPLIFDRFYRTDHSRTTQNGPGGTGLGLAIVKNITDMHHGAVSVSSDLSGTVFTVKLKIHFEEGKENFESRNIESHNHDSRGYDYRR